MRGVLRVPHHLRGDLFAKPFLHDFNVKQLDLQTAAADLVIALVPPIVVLLVSMFTVLVAQLGKEIAQIISKDGKDPGY